MGLFCHTYNIHAKVELKNGEFYTVTVPLIARFVTKDELITSFKNLVQSELNSPVKRIIELYDASNLIGGIYAEK
jgi:hypothetical protein